MKLLRLKSKYAEGTWYFKELLESDLTLTSDKVHAYHVAESDLESDLCEANCTGFEFEPEDLPEAEKVVPVFLEGLVDILHRYYGEGCTMGTMMAFQIDLNSWFRQARVFGNDCIELGLDNEGYVVVSFKEGTSRSIRERVACYFKDVSCYVDNEFSFDDDSFMKEG